MLKLSLPLMMLVAASSCIDPLDPQEAADAKASASTVTAAPVRMPIAINGPRTGPSPGFQGDALYLSGAVQSAVFQIAGVPTGAKIVGAHIRVRDNANGPTRLDAVLYPSVDGSQGAPVVISSASSGTGNAQTLTLSSFTTIVAPLTSYSIYVNTISGAAVCSVLGIDVDYIPAT